MIFRDFVSSPVRCLPCMPISSLTKPGRSVLVPAQRPPERRPASDHLWWSRNTNEGQFASAHLDTIRSCGFEGARPATLKPCAQPLPTYGLLLTKYKEEARTTMDPHPAWSVLRLPLLLPPLHFASRTTHPLVRDVLHVFLASFHPLLGAGVHERGLCPPPRPACPGAQRPQVRPLHRRRA